jgi:hypothetical protein
VNRHLQIDHDQPVEEQGPTARWNLNRLGHHHHRVKTVGKLRLDGIGLHEILVPARVATGPVSPEPAGRDAARHPTEATV